jgi:hypothetical protein
VVPLQVQRVAQVLSVVPTGFDKETVLDAPLEQGLGTNVLIFGGPVVVGIGSRKVLQLVRF